MFPVQVHNSPPVLNPGKSVTIKIYFYIARQTLQLFK
ncbi:hypothetical protein BMETH_609_0 [methanotrophic bacterial endosymbiont of Bathymodiolus sp.]|nr:hypothetical protein BMETH_609_0 [methanotrophic bacterial endosymbiont of Bathymodiolus sp.]